MTVMTIARDPSPATPSLIARLAEMLAATDRFVTWYGAHRAWPANEPAQIDKLPL
jgi:hypothetical protein